MASPSALLALGGNALLSCWGLASALVPATHCLGVALYRSAAPPPPQGPSRRRRVPGPCAAVQLELNFLLTGGSRHLVLQALSFALWLCGVLVAVPTLHALWRGVRGPHLELLCAAAAVVGYCSLLFQLKALLVFEPTAAPPRLLSRAFAAGSSSLCWDVSRLPSRTARAYIVTAIGLLWVGLGGALLLATEFLHDATALTVYYALAAACITTGAFTTHGLAGFLRHAGGANGGSGADGGGVRNSVAGGGGEGSWRFWQPFRGGTAFVLAQALGWALYGSGLVAIIYLLSQAVAGVAYCVRCWAVAAGAIAFTSELFLAGSLLTFQGKHIAHAAPSGPSLRERLADALVIAMFYVPMHVFIAVVALTFMVLPPAHAAALWLGGLFVYYSVTAFGSPEHTGRREWPAMQKWVGEQLERVLPAWLGSFSVAMHGGKAAAAAFDPAKRYVFGFCHHGLYPLGAGYLPFLPSFRSVCPVWPVTLSASICVTVPLLRDICLWLGVRVVSRRTFVHTLRERKAVLICPGGQAEMCLTNRLHRHKEFTIYAGHKGFVRIALQEGAALVPVLALGEADSLHNLIEWPSMQRLCTKKLGFPIPFVIAGRWWLPLPARTHLKFVIGQPVEAPPLAVPGQPSQAEVDALHQRFYAALRELWDAHAPSFPGYADVSLVMVHKEQDVAAAS